MMGRKETRVFTGEKSDWTGLDWVGGEGGGNDTKALTHFNHFHMIWALTLGFVRSHARS